LHLAVNTRDWTFTSKISAMLGTLEKERHIRRSIVYKLFNFSCFNTDVLYHIFAYLGKLAYQGSFVSSK
ncbi:hypothetical protein, partial [Blautia wexlerae]|uniref:hypothetical protein n=1 Tax=Blautia wexlerae TaxID=418240 RepID=UPI0032195687